MSAVACARLSTRVHTCMNQSLALPRPKHPQMPETERDAADLWLLNSCTVKNPSEASVVNLIAKVRRSHDDGRGTLIRTHDPTTTHAHRLSLSTPQAKEQGKAVVVSGCVPQGDRHNAALKEGVSVIGVTQLPRVVEVVSRVGRHVQRRPCLDTQCNCRLPLIPIPPHTCLRRWSRPSRGTRCGCSPRPPCQASTSPRSAATPSSRSSPCPRAAWATAPTARRGTPEASWGATRSRRLSRGRRRCCG